MCGAGPSLFCVPRGSGLWYWFVAAVQGLTTESLTEV
jgi:hypothetical protein